jgi:hypothetical protein
MSDKDIFSGSDQSQSTEVKDQLSQSNQGDPQNPLTILVGEGRKYKTTEELAKAYLNVDGFAEKLKTENAALRQEVVKGKTLEEVLERLKQEQGGATQDQGEKKVEQPKAASGLSASDVAAIVRKEITGAESTRVKETNLKKADAEMRKLFGDKAAEEFSKRANTPELRKAMTDLAAVAPDQFLAMFRPTQVVSGTGVDHGTSVNAAALENQQASGRALDPGCKEFYDVLRRTKPAAYYSAPIQLQMQKAAIANPGKFNPAM